MQKRSPRWLGWLTPGLFIVACSTSDPAIVDTAEITDGDGGASAACGRGETLCAEGSGCEGAPDCSSGICRNGVCGAVVPGDGSKNNDESDVDCGGAGAPACDDGKGCHIADDCTSGVCSGGVCQAPSASDGVKNGDETGKDCGGPTSATPRCGVGESCKAVTDCDALRCDPTTKKCAAATHDDGVQNLGETDVDCGGPTTKCAVGKKCLATSDCDNVKCNPDTKVCDPANRTDQIKNGTETDVDCGGAPVTTTRCAADKVCKTDTDCASKGCDDRGRCAAGRSCTQKLGGRTCGPGELAGSEPNADHESCCERSPLVAGGPKKIDKYLITAGRMRQFITRENGKIRDWVTQAVKDGVLTGWNTTTMNGLVPNTLAEANIQLGAYWTGAPNDSNGANSKRSCDADYSNGHTYWTNNAEETDSDYTQAELDVKALNCIGWHLMRAFCAWEGGRIATRAELLQAYKNNGTTKYPWGNTFDGTRLNHEFNYLFPVKANARKRGVGQDAYLADIAVFVAPPGRFPTGANKLGVQDVAGNMLEWTNDGATTYIWNYSWEGHDDTGNRLDQKTWQSDWKGEPNGYYAIGGRCAYP